MWSDGWPEDLVLRDLFYSSSFKFLSRWVHAPGVLLFNESNSVKRV